MKYFLDSEFMENGETIELLSLAIVSETGEERYFVNSDADRTKANDWVKEHVIPRLDTHPDGGFVLKGCRQDIAHELKRFVGDAKPEFWGYYAAYDWVAFCQLFGKMIDLPKGYPMFCRDLIQEVKRLGNPPLPKQGKDEHHALLDARWNKIVYELIVKKSS